MVVDGAGSCHSNWRRQELTHSNRLARRHSNRALACAACNSFRNRYPFNKVTPTSLEEFYVLRDEIFVERRQLILGAHQEELKFFESRPWAIPHNSILSAGKNLGS